MIDWLDKLPDSLTGVAMASALWFGANYAILADRAIAKYHAATAPSCLAAIDRHERGLQLVPSRIGSVVGMPGLDEIEQKVLQLVKPRLLPPSEKQELCACALNASTRGLRFEYAIHTASFRIIQPASIAGLGTGAVSTLMSSVCGALPSIKRLG